MNDIQKMAQVRKLEMQLDSAILESIIRVTCPQCGRILPCEPDAETVYCDKCDKVVKPIDSLVAQGLV